MPSIAQQDYLHLISRGSMLGDFSADARLIAGMLRAQERGILPDAILSYQNSNAWTKPLSFQHQNSPERYGISYYAIGGNSQGTTTAITLRPWSPVVYDGLAAIQDARFSDGDMFYLPQLSAGETLKATILSVTYFICVNGKKLASTWGVTSDGDDILTAIEMTEDAVGESDDYLNISWEDAQKLIGYWR